MAMKQDRTIINCAITGAIHIPTQSDYLPITPQQITEEAVRAANAGAGTVHLHMRDPATGQPNSDIGLFREVCSEIQRQTNVVQCTTTGGPLGAGPEERVRVVRELEPELASMNMGSVNFGLFHLVERFDRFKEQWERSYLERTKDFVFKNTFHDMEIFLKTMQDHGTKPEMECFDVGHIHNAAFMADRGFMKPPFYFQFVMGILGGIQPGVENLLHMKSTADRLLGEDYAWSALAVGRHQFALGTVAAVLGGNVRVGMEDNLYYSKGRLLKSNEEAVAKMRRMLEEIGVEIANPGDVRQRLNLKGQRLTKF